MEKHFRKLAGYLNDAARRDALRKDGSWWARADEQVASTPIRFQPTLVSPRPEDRYVTCVPLVPLAVAAGQFSDPQSVDESALEWIELTERQLKKGMFVSQVVGKSMEPTIPDGSHCLFEAPVVGSRQGRIVLAQLRDAMDPESGRYTVKRYESEKVTAADGAWRHEKITLKPANKDFQTIEITADDEGAVAVIAEFKAVLG